MLIVVPVTALYAGLYALLLLVLAARISRQRMTLKVGLGDGGNPPLVRAVRVHGNAVEWMLPMLVLLLIAELNHANHLFLHTCGIVFLAARIAHAAGLSGNSGESAGRFRYGSKLAGDRRPRGVGHRGFRAHADGLARCYPGTGRGYVTREGSAPRPGRSDRWRTSPFPVRSAWHEMRC